MIRINVISKLIDIIEVLTFAPKILKFYKNNLQKYDKLNIVDVGANVGQSIKIFKKINKNYFITSYEPNPKLYNFLKLKYNSNKNIKILNKALSNYNGNLTFYENILDKTSSLEMPILDSKFLIKKAKILGIKPVEIIKNKYLVNVNKFIDEFPNNPFIHILKIDVEGHELNVLKGIFINKNLILNILYIQLEKQKSDMYKDNSEEIDKILFENGFKLVTIIKHSFGDFFENIYINKNLNNQ